MTAPGGVLAGRAVLVTRPRHQAGELCRILESRGARTVLLPTVRIEPLDGEEQRERARALVPHADWLVFTSPNAATLGIELLAGAGVSPAERCRLAAVGAGTASALRAAGRHVDVEPASGGGAEFLLRHPAMARLRGQRTVIVRGEGGRELLAEGLKSRGARVSHLEVYRRTRPEADTSEAARGWREGILRFTIVTSGTGLGNLLSMLGPEDRERLLGTRLVTVSERLATAARQAGFRYPPVVASEPSDRALAEAVERAATDDHAETPDT